jgi:cytochrome c biogenesis protein CcdA/thiol-disulfide isomerase/thioredoxin
LLTLLIFAFLAGVITVISPCILPVLPILFAAGIGEGRYRPVGIVLGLVISFTFLTLALTAVVQATGISPTLLRSISIALLIIFGLMLIFPVFGDYFAQLTSGIANVGISVQQRATLAGKGFWSGLIMGSVLGLVWTPCAGPVLATITTLVALHTITWGTVLIAFFYSLGAALPMFLIIHGGAKIASSTQLLARYSQIIQRIFGILTILSALAIAFHGDVILEQLAFKYFPSIKIEDNPLLKKELSALLPIMKGPTMMAPDFIGIQAWINSPPLTITQLRGSVVLVDFWTYSCINCIRTLPHLKKWYADYKDQGFIIIGVHTPEFEFEKNLNNVQDAVKRFEITYPVALDNDYKTWRNYNNYYWPAHYLVDQQGVIQETHFGEGGYQETENAIRSLLGLTPLSSQQEAASRKSITPETYLGYERADRYHPSISFQKDKSKFYVYQPPLAHDYIGLKGSWLIKDQFIQAQADDCILDLNFIAHHVYLVMRSEAPALVTVMLDDKPIAAEYRTKDMNQQGQILVQEPRVYDIIDLKEDYGRHNLSLQVPKGICAYVFTFG